MERSSPNEPAMETDYFISESPAGLVLEYRLRPATTERVQSSRLEPDAIVFRHPDRPGVRWRGPDLALRYHPPDHLSVTTFDVIYSFRRAR
jgi:hypothetical protein